MAALTQHSHKAIINIISEMTRPITDILGEPPLTLLEPSSRKLRRPIPSRTKDTPSEEAILSITRYYGGPNSCLQGGRLSPELTETRKRPRVERNTADSLGRKRRREEKPPRPEATTTKRNGEIKMKLKTEDTKPHPLGIKLISQPAPRESDEIRKAPRTTNGTSLRKRESAAKEAKKESKKLVKEDPEDAPMKDVKETSRKPLLAISRSAPPPIRSATTEKARSETERQKAKTKETDRERSRSSIPRVRRLEKTEGKRREDMLRSSAKEPSDLSTSSSERKRPRSRPMDGDTARQHDSETDRELERREKRRTRERDGDFESDRERPSRDGDRERERERVRDRDRDRNRDRDRDRDRDSDRNRDRDRLRSGRDERGQESGTRNDQRKELRDRDSEHSRREHGRLDDSGRGTSDQPNEHKREVTRDKERPRIRSSVPLSRPDSGRESASGRASPSEVRGIPLSSKPVVRSAAGTGDRSSQSQQPGSQQSSNALHENIAKQKEMKEEFLALVAKCKELNQNKDYDAYEKKSKRAFRRGFELGLTMEAELRIDAVRYKALNANKRALRNRPIITHYRALTKTYADKWQSDFDRLGRVKAVSFFKRSTRKVYFRMFIVHHQWNKDMLYAYRGLEDMLDKVVKGRKSGKSNKEKEEELPSRKLEALQNVVHDFSNICSIFDGIANDFESNHEEQPGTESYIPS